MKLWWITNWRNLALVGLSVLVAVLAGVILVDQFQGERVDTVEEPVLEGKHLVTIRGNVRFNYSVNPGVLASKMRLIDPLQGETNPIPLELETTYRSQDIGFHSKPVEKQKDKRELRLVILSDLKPEGGNLPLAADWVHTVPLG